VNIPPHLQGLRKEQVQQARLQYGTNEWNFKAEKGWWKMAKQLVSEPMVIMLLAASCLYFISGKQCSALFRGNPYLRSGKKEKIQSGLILKGV